MNFNRIPSQQRNIIIDKIWIDLTFMDLNNSFSTSTFQLVGQYYATDNVNYTNVEWKLNIC